MPYYQTGALGLISPCHNWYCQPSAFRGLLGHAPCHMYFQEQPFSARVPEAAGTPLKAPLASGLVPSNNQFFLFFN